MTAKWFPLDIDYWQGEVMANETSEFKFYSIGIVAEDKKVGSDYIKVSPREVLPFFNGNISEHGQDYKAEAPVLPWLINDLI